MRSVDLSNGKVRIFPLDTVQKVPRLFLSNGVNGAVHERLAVSTVHHSFQSAERVVVVVIVAVAVVVVHSSSGIIIMIIGIVAVAVSTRSFRCRRVKKRQRHQSPRHGSTLSSVVLVIIGSPPQFRCIDRCNVFFVRIRIRIRIRIRRRRRIVVVAGFVLLRRVCVRVPVRVHGTHHGSPPPASRQRRHVRSHFCPFRAGKSRRHVVVPVLSRGLQELRRIRRSLWQMEPNN
mmetsp:Transcript_3804/g.8538  ORF Transcript_3804/g.8538 Transcript_3804/m.8538 type:complete len:232 (-) Transcript_3804:126-821(-)